MKTANVIQVATQIMVKIACLNDVFSEYLKLEGGPVEGRSLQQKDKKGRKTTGALTK